MQFGKFGTNVKCSQFQYLIEILSICIQKRFSVHRDENAVRHADIGSLCVT